MTPINELAQQLDIRRPNILQAEAAAQRIVETLKQRGLDPAFSAFHLTRYANILILIAELDTAHLERMERYMTEDLIHQISTRLQGKRVYLSNTTGLRYVVPLSKPPRLPQRIEFLLEETERGKLSLGVNFTGDRVAVSWEQAGHLLVAGMTGSGKSMFLRLVVWQAIRDGMKLLLADIDQATFPMLANHPALMEPVGASPQEAVRLIQRALEECDKRAGLYREMEGFPENLEEYNRLAVKAGIEPLPRVLLVLDEFSATMKALGGGKSAAGDLLAAIGFRGRKFGVSVVFAAHEFTKEQVGLLRDQVRSVVMFRVQNAEMARRLGCHGAERIPSGRPGLAVSNRWGPLQTYYYDKARLIQAADQGETLTPIERSVFGHALLDDGKVSIANVQRWGGVSEWQARKWLRELGMRNLVRKDPNQSNVFVITEKMRDLLSNHQTPQTPQTAWGTSQTLSNRLSGFSNALKPTLLDTQTALEAQ
jgi:hypothetical protein